MQTFRNYIAQNFHLEMPSPTIPGSWFTEHDLPMIVACSCCGMMMSSPSAWIDRDGYCYCGGCAGAEDE